MLIFGDESGHITFADRDFHVSDRRHKIFKGEVLSLAYLFDPSNSNRQFIFAVGDDSRAKEISHEETMMAGGGIPPIYMIKIYASSDMNRPIQVINATTSGESVLTSFAVTLDGNEIAVGYSNGRVVLYPGPFFKDSTQSRPGAPTVLFQPNHGAPVSSLYFCEFTSKSQDERKVKLFVVLDTKEDEVDDEMTRASLMNKPAGMELGVEVEDINKAGIVVFDTSYTFANPSKNSVVLAPRADPKALDNRGAPALCTSFMKTTGELMVSRNEALFTYTVEDRGGALAIFGEKLCLSAVSRYTMVVSIDDKPIPLEGGNSSNAAVKPRKPNVNIYDLKNKIICGTTRKYTLPANDRVLFVLSDSGMVYLVTTSLTMIRFREKDVNRKLDVLLNQVKPPLYSLAIMLAGEEQLEASEIMKLYKMYGDHLYSKHEYEAAITQYCSTIGYIPPSYVIIKFLDPYRIHNLITYLEKIKEKSLAGSDHITLLLSCYTKIKDDRKIGELLDYVFNQHGKVNKASVHSSSIVNTKGASADKHLFDPNQAIKILNGAGFTEFALKVAVKYLRHESYFSIQLSKQPPQYDETLGYLAYTSFVCQPEEVLHTIQQYGRQLLQHRPAAFTTLLIKLCTADMESFLPITTIVSNNNKKTATTSSTSTSTTNAELTSQIWSSDFWRVLHSLLSTHKNLASSMNMQTENPTLVAQDVISVFNDNDDQLFVFLEGVVQGNKGRILAPKVWVTVLELYMQKYQHNVNQLRHLKQRRISEEENTEQLIHELNTSIRMYESTILSLMDGANVTYDQSHVLLLCHIYQFEKGERYLLEKQNYIELLMKKMIENADSKEVLKLLIKEGTKEPELYVQVLTFFVQQTMSGSSGQSSNSNKRRDDRDSDSDDDGGYRRNDASDDDDDESNWDAVVDVLDLIEKEGILSPAQVLSILALNPTLPLYIVGDYVSNTFRELTDQIATVESDVTNAISKLESTSFNAQNENEVRICSL